MKILLGTIYCPATLHVHGRCCHRLERTTSTAWRSKEGASGGMNHWRCRGNPPTPLLLFYVLLCVLIVVVTMLVVPVRAGCQSFSCPVPTCVQYGGSETMAGGRAVDTYVVLGATGGLSTQAYNDSRLGKFATARVFATTQKAASATCSNAQGQLVTPPYDEDMYNLMVDKGACFWIGGTLLWYGELSFTGVSGSSGFYSYTCNPSFLTWTKSPVFGRPLGTECKSAISGDYNSNSQKAYVVCVRPSSTAATVTWIDRGDGYEELRMKYSLSAALATSFCQSVGGDLGTVKNDSHASIVFDAIGRYWVGYRCGNTAESCAWLESSSSVSIKAPVGGSLPNVVNVPNGGPRVLQEASNTDDWNSFLCSRQIQTIAVSLVGKCYTGQSCSATVLPSRRIEWFHLQNDNAQLQFAVSVGGVSLTTVGFVSQQASRTISLTAPAPGNVNVQVSMVGVGYNFVRVVATSISVRALETVSFTGATTTATYFANQGFTLSVVKSSTDTVGISAVAFPFVTSTTWAGTAGTMAVTVTNPGTYSPTFSVTGQSFYQPTTIPSARSFVILTQSTLGTTSSSSAASVLVHGDSFIITATPSTAISSVGGAFSITPTISPVDAPLSLASGALTWAVGASGAKSITYSCTNPGSSAVPVTVALSFSHPQFVGSSASFTYTVRPRIAITMSGSGTYATNENYVVSLAVPRIYTAGVSFALTCGGAVISPASSGSMVASATPVTMAFTISSATSLTCAMGGVVSGSTSSYYIAPTVTTTTFAATPILSATLDSSSVYATQGSTIFFSATPATELGAELLKITIVGTSLTNVGLSQQSVTLSSGQNTASVTLTTAVATSGTFTFVVSSTASFPNTITGLSFTVLPLERVTVVPTSLATPQSIGFGYTQLLTFSLPSQPEGTNQTTGTINYNTSVFSILPSSSFTWSASDTALVTKQVTIVAIGLSALPSPLSVSFGLSSSVKVNRTTLFLGSVSTYRRALINVSLSRGSSFGALPVTLTVNTSRTPTQGTNLTIVCSIPTDFGGGVRMLNITSNGTNRASATFVPVQQSSTVGYFACSLLESNLERDQYDGNISSLECTVYPLRTADLSCNDTRLFFAARNALLCTLTVELLTANLFAVPISNPLFQYSALQLAYTSATTATFTVVPASGVSVQDGSDSWVTWSISDDTFTVPTFKVVVKQPLVVSVAVPPYIYVGTEANASANAFLMLLSVSPAPDSAGVVGIVQITLTGLAFNLSSVSFSLSDPLTQAVLCWGTAPQDYTFKFQVSGSAAFLSTTTSLTRFLRPLVAVTTQTVSPSFVYVGQNATVSVSVSDVLPSAKITFIPVFYCAGADATNTTITSEPANASVQDTTTSAGLTISAQAPCNGFLSLRLVTTSPIVNTSSGDNTTFTILSKKSSSMSVGPVLYCGGTNTSLLSISLGGAPNSSFYGVVLTSNASLVTLGVSVFNFTRGSSITSLATTITAPTCPLTASNATIVATVQASDAVSEYSAPTTQSLTVEVRPLLRAQLPDLFPASTLYVGESVVVNVSVPQPPLGGSLSYSVTSNASISVLILPGTDTFAEGATNLTRTFSVRAITPATVAITMVWSGTANQYLPHPSKTWVIDVVALGVVSVSSQLPASLFAGASAFPVVVATTKLPVASDNVTVTITSSNTTCALVSPNVLVWNATSVSFAAAFTIIPLAAGSVVFTLVLSAPPTMFNQTLNVWSFTVPIVNDRAIVWSVPTFIYVGAANAVLSRITLSKLPPTGQTLSLSSSIPAAQAPNLVVSSIAPFSASTSTSQEVQIQGLAAMENVRLTLINTTVLLLYDVPTPVFTTIRALETVTLVGLPRAMYVGQVRRFLVTLSRLPTCAAGTLVITPTSNLISSAVFSTSQLVFSSTDQDVSQEAAVTAIASTLQAFPVALSFVFSGSCTSIYAQVAPVTLHVFSTESVTIGLPTINQDSESFFMYQGTVLPLTVSLGTPAIYHTQTVVVLLEFQASNAFLSFANSTVYFPPGVNTTFVNITGLQPTGTPAAITATVLQGADVFATTNALTLRVLPRIAITATFQQASLRFFVQNIASAATIVIDSSALVGDLNVSFAFGSEVTFGLVTFKANTPATSGSVSILANALCDPKTLTIVLSGPGAAAYLPTQAIWSDVSVRPQRSVLVSAPFDMYVGALNAKSITFSIDPTTTDLVDDQVTITLLKPQQASWSSSSVVLSTATPSRSAVLTAQYASDLSLGSLCTVHSTSNQYAATVSASPSLVRVFDLLQLAVWNFSSVLFVGDTSTFQVEITSSPLNGSVRVIPLLGAVDSGSYTFTPASVVLNATHSVANVTITVAAAFSGTVTLQTTHSPEFDPTGASLSLQVNEANEIAMFNFPSRIYVSAVNQVAFHLSVHAAPVGGNTMSVTVEYDVQGKFVVSPSTVHFNASSGLQQTITLQGLSTTENAQVRFVITDPTSFYAPIGSRVLTVIPLETITGTNARSLVYVNNDTTIVIRFSDPPKTALTLNVFLQQPRQDNQNAYVILPADAYEITPGASVVLIGNASATFRIKALKSGYTPHITFSVLRNTESVRYDTTQLPSYDLRFVALRTISIAAPSVVNVGLLCTATVSLSVTPDVGTSVAMTASTTSALVLGNTAVTFNPGDLTKTFSLTPSILGAFTVIFSINPSTDNVAYVKQADPSSWVFTVQKPSVLTLIGKPPAVYVGPLNAFYLNVSGYGTMSTGETLYVNLTCASPSVTIFPTEVEVGSMTPAFSLSSPIVTTTTCNISFRASINRFVMDPMFLEGGTGLGLSFIPLKSSTVAAPSTATPYVNQWVSVAVSVSVLPSPGRVLIAALVYSGSSANIELSPPISWSSQSPNVTQSLMFRGLSPTDTNSISVALSNDNSYSALTTTYPIQFLAYVLIDVTPPLQAFVGQRMPIRFYPQELKVFSVTLSFGIPGAITPFSTDSSGTPVPSATITWVFQDTNRQKTGYLQCNVAGDVRVDFTVGGQDASAFATPSSVVVRCLPVTTVLVNAPANDMQLYFTDAFFSEVSVQVLFRPPVGTLVVVPTVVCSQPPSKIISIDPSVLFFNSSYALQQSIVLKGIAVGGPCEMTFPLSGNSTGYVGNRKFTVSVKPLVNISVDNVPTKVYVGAENSVPLNFFLDSSVVLPLLYPVTIQLATSAIGQLCISVSPSALYWAALSSTETLSKTVTITATCSTTAIQSISATVSAAPNVYRSVIPTAITFSALPLVDVVVSSIPVGQRNFILYVGGSTLTLAVEPKDPLTATESIEISAVYKGSLGSITQLAAVWLPSTVFTTKKQMIINPVSVSPNAVLEFKVTGPPRFNKLSPGSWTLQVVGKATVRVTIPTPMITGNDYHVVFTLGSLLEDSEVLIVTPQWYGSSSALEFLPTSLTFLGTDSGLQKTMILRAKSFQGGYRMVVGVSGSARFEATAFDGIVVINEAIQIISTSLPTQLMKGQTYQLGIDIRRLPPTGSTVTVRTTTIAGPECITFPSGSTFRFTSDNPNAPTTQTVPVVVTKINCQTNDLPFEVEPTSDLSYSRSVPSRTFRTVAAGPVSLDWPTKAYVRSENSVAGLILLMDTIDSASSTLSVNMSGNVFATVSSKTATFTYGSAPSVEIQFYHSIAESVTFNFNIYRDGSTVATTSLTTTTLFIPLISMSTTFSSVDNVLYLGNANAQRFEVTLGSPMVATDNAEPRRIRLAVITNSTSGSVKVQPSFMEWSVGYAQSQFVSLIGINTLDPYVRISFQLSGTGSSFISTVPSAFVLPVAAPLLITYTQPPVDMYVGNSILMTITLPTLSDGLVRKLRDGNIFIVVSILVIGESDSLVITPANVTWTPGTNYSSTRAFSIVGTYASSSPKILTPVIQSGPTWMSVTPSTQGTTVNRLRSLTLTPASTSYSWYTNQEHIIYFSPASVSFTKCNSTYDLALGVDVRVGFIILYTRSLTRVVSFECYVNDTSYQNPPRTTVTILARKTIAFLPNILYTYVGVVNNFAVTVDPLPSTILVMSPKLNFSADYFSMSPDALTYGPTSDRLLQWSVSGRETSPLLTLGIDVVYTLDEFVDYTNLAVKVQILPFLQVTIQSVNLQLNLTGVNMWYRTSSMNNLVEFRVSIPRSTVFNSILVAPRLDGEQNTALRFCASSQGCTNSDYTVKTPIVFDQSVTQRSVYVYANAAVVRDIVFDVLNAADCIDYGGNSSLFAGRINFQELETLIVDASAMREILYIGVNNSQVLRLKPSNPPLGASSAEIVVSLPGNLVGTVLTTGVGFASSDRGNGQYTLSWTGTAMEVFMRITGIVKSTGIVQIYFWWRNKPTNFDAFSSTTVSIRVNPPITFTVDIPQTSGTVHLSPTDPTFLTIYVGADNQLLPVIATTTFPVITSDMLTVQAIASIPNVLSISPSIINLASHTNNGAKAVTCHIYAFPIPNGGQAVDVAVLFKVRETTTPPEFNRTEYRIQLRVQPLLTLNSSLSSLSGPTIIAVGPENAITFTLQPSVDVTLSLNALVTCSDVSFTPVDALSWVNSSEPKRLRVSATSATGASIGRCVIVTRTLPGGDQNIFAQPPFNATIYSLAKPTVAYAPQSSVPAGTVVASKGYNITIQLSGSYFTFADTPLLTLLVSGGISITSDRTAGEEPASFAALVDRQRRGGAAFAFMFLSDDKRSMTIQFGPSSAFQTTTLESIVVTVGRDAIAQAVTVDPAAASATFQVRGVKKELLGNTGGFIGSGTSAASIVGAIVSMTSAQQANRLQTISEAFICPNQDWRESQDSFAWNDQLIPLSFGSNEDLGGFAAVGVSDLIVILGAMVVHLGIAWCVYEHRRKGSYADKSFAAALAKVRFPSFLLVPVMFFYQTMVASALTTIMYSPRLHLRMVGAFTLVVFGFGIPVATYTVIGPGFRAEYVTEDEARRRTAKKRYLQHLRTILGKDVTTTVEHQANMAVFDEAPAVNKEEGDAAVKPAKEQSAERAPRDDLEAFVEPPTRKRSAFGRFMLLFKPTGEWVCEDDPYWILRYELFFGEYRGGRHRYLAVDLTLTFLLGVVDGIRPINETQCLGRTSAYVFLFGIQFILILGFRPYNSAFGNGFFILAYFLQFLSMIFVAIAVFRSDSSWDGVQVAVNALVIFGSCLYCKTFLDFLQSVNENFELEKFFEEREDLAPKQIQGKRAEEQIVRNFEAEITTKMIRKQQEVERANIGFLLSGAPQHDGRTLEEIEREMMERDRKTQPYDPSKVLAKYTGPDGGDADSEEEQILEEHERMASRTLPKVNVRTSRLTAAHYYDQQADRMRPVKRLDDHFEKLLANARERELHSTSAASPPRTQVVDLGHRAHAPRGAASGAGPAIIDDDLL